MWGWATINVFTSTSWKNQNKNKKTNSNYQDYKQLKKNPLHIEYSMWNRIFHIENMNLWEHIAYKEVTLIPQPSYENLKCNFIFQYCNYSFHQCFIWVFFSWGMVWTHASEPDSWSFSSYMYFPDNPSYQFFLAYFSACLY